MIQKLFMNEFLLTICFFDDLKIIHEWIFVYNVSLMILFIYYKLKYICLLYILECETPINPNHALCTQPAITCSKLTIEPLDQGVKYVQS